MSRDSQQLSQYGLARREAILGQAKDAARYRHGKLVLARYAGACTLVAFVAIGVRLGSIVRDRMNPDTFRLAVLVVLLVIGASLVMRPLL